MNNLAGVNFENGHTVKGCFKYSSLPPRRWPNLRSLVKFMTYLLAAGSHQYKQKYISHQVYKLEEYCFFQSYLHKWAYMVRLQNNE